MHDGKRIEAKNRKEKTTLEQRKNFGMSLEKFDTSFNNDFDNH